MTNFIRNNQQNLRTRLERIKARLIPYASKLTEPYRLITASMRAIPDYLIIGVQKAGTTSLYKYLKQHPNVQPVFSKEVHFFDRHFDKGLDWYRSHFQFSRDGYITGEATPEYIFHPYSYKRISEFLPSVKIIVLLRNPIDRAYSRYNHSCRSSKYRSKIKSFEQAIAKEKELLSSFNLNRFYENERFYEDERCYKAIERHSYLSRGIYITQIKRWFNCFPREQILILKSENLYSDPSGTYKKVLEFLNLPNWEPKNYSIFNYSEGYPKMNTATREYLIDYFKPYNEQLYEHIGMNFDWDK